MKQYLYLAMLYSVLFLLLPCTAMARAIPYALFLGPMEVCAPETVTFENSSSGGNLYTWYVDNVQQQQTATPEDFTWLFVNSSTMPEVYEIRLIVDNGLGDSDEYLRGITVYPEVHAAFSANQTSGCHPLDVDFTNNSTGFSGTWEWNFGDGGSNWVSDPSHTFHNFFDPDKLTYEVSLVATSPDMCRDTARLDITVNPHIEALFTADTVTGCHELEVTFTDLSAGADTYIWNMDDGTIYNHHGGTFSHTFINNTGITQSYTINLRVENDESCFDEIQKTIVVFPRVSADFAAVPQTGCSQLSVLFQNNSSGASEYLWEFGDNGTSLETDPVHVYDKNTGNSNETYQARLIAISDDMCRDTSAYTPITVHPHVEADFSIDVAEGCHPLTVTISNNSTGADNHLWEFGDGSPDSSTDDANFTRTFENTSGTIQIYTIRLTAENSYGCDHVIEKEVTVYPEVNAGFTANNDEGCSQLTIGFTNSSSGAADYLWEFGDGGTSTEEHPVHTYAKNTGSTDQVHQARLIAISSELCRDTTGYQDITVYPHIEAGFTMAQAEGCHPFQVTVDDNSTGAETYHWDMGDGTVYNQEGGSITHTYNNTGNNPLFRTIRLTVTNSRGCDNYFEKIITVYPVLTSAFTTSTDEGCEPLTVDFSNTSDNADYYLWDFGDGATSSLEDPQHTFFNPAGNDTVYTVQLTSFSAGGECIEVSQKDITVHGRVNADFSFNMATGCNPFEVEFNNSSSGAESYIWDFGDGTIVNSADAFPVSHTFDNISFSDILEYDVTMTAVNYAGCTDQSVLPVSVYPSIKAEFSASVNLGCHPLTVDFSNMSQGEHYYHWDFGNGKTSAQAGPTHTFTNTGTTDSIYTVTLVTTAENNVCSDSFSIDITVHPYLMADFDLPENIGCTPFEAVLENSSVNGAEYHWDFGDGNDSVTFNNNPFPYKFTNSGFSDISEYPVTMKAISNEGCESEMVKTVKVYPDINADFQVSDLQGCQPLTVDFTDVSSGAYHYEWDFGDGSSSAESSPSHTYTNTGSTDSIFRVMLRVTAANNVCSDSFYMDIRVHPMVKADFSFPEGIQCTPAEFTFNNSSTGGEIYRWNFGDGTDTITYNMNGFGRRFANASYTSKADFPVTLEAENYAGCTHQIQRTVSLHADVRAAVTPSVNEGCNPLPVDFDNISQGGYTYRWDFGDGAFTDKENPSHIFTNFSGNRIEQEVTLTATSQSFCTADTTFTISVYPLPVPVIDIEKSVDCPPFDLLIDNLTLGAENYTWLFGDGSSTTTGDRGLLTHTYNNSGDDIAGYDLKLIAKTDYGCVDSAQQKIFVYPGVITGFSSVTEGCSPLTARFTDESVRAVTHEWHLGDGSFSRVKDPVHQYLNNSVNDTSFYVQQTGISEYGCRDSMGYHIDVYPQPVSRFTALPTHQTWPSATIEIENMTNPGNWDFEWNFDDGTTSVEKDPGAHEYGDWGEYEIGLYVSSTNCSHSISRRIRILPPPPVAEFEHPGPGCAPHGVQFRNNSVYGSSYFWEFGDGNTSADPEPYHIFEEPGLYSVKLTVTGAGGAEFAYREVEVYRLPEVSFMVSPELVMLPGQKVQLFNESKFGSSYLWDFGDGIQSGLESPIHQYTETGDYDIRLSVWTDDGCYGEMTKHNAVTVTGEGIIAFPNAFRPDIYGPSGGSYNRNALNPNTVFYPLHAGIEEYRLEIYNRWGELLFVSEDIEIGWDGYYQGKISKQDVYVWKAWGNYINGEEFIKAGDVTLLR